MKYDDPRRSGRGHACLGRQVDEAQQVIPQHSDFGCLSVRVPACRASLGAGTAHADRRLRGLGA